MFWNKRNKNELVTLPSDEEGDDGEKLPSYLKKRPKPLKNAIKKQGNELLPYEALKKLSPEEIRYIMAKIKSGDFKRFDRNEKGHNLLHIFTGLKISKLARAFIEMVQSDPRVLNALDNAGNSALDYATEAEVKNLIKAYGGKKSVEILDQYSREAIAMQKSMGDSPSTKNRNDNQR